MSPGSFAPARRRLSANKIGVPRDMLRRERGRAEDDIDEDESYIYDDDAYDDFFDRQLERPDGEPGGDGYYVRTSEGRLIGPLYEHRFERLRSGRQKHRIRSAYRLSAGHVFPITLRTRFVWSNVCSCAACGHALELCIVFIAFASTARPIPSPSRAPIPRAAARLPPRTRLRRHSSSGSSLSQRRAGASGKDRGSPLESSSLRCA